MQRSMRSLPVSTILDNTSMAGYEPDVDGTVLTQSIGPALASGQFSHVPVIIGTKLTNGGCSSDWRNWRARSR